MAWVSLQFLTATSLHLQCFLVQNRMQPLLAPISVTSEHQVVSDCAVLLSSCHHYVCSTARTSTAVHPFDVASHYVWQVLLCNSSLHKTPCTKEYSISWSQLSSSSSSARTTIYSNEYLRGENPSPMDCKVVSLSVKWLTFWTITVLSSSESCS